MINDRVYIIDFDKLIKWCFITFLRQPKTLLFIGSILKPLKTRYQEFIMFKDDSKYKASHNSQLCRMRKVLNDKFDDSLRRIEIRNAKIFQPNWLYHPEDNKPEFLYNPQDNIPNFLYSPNDFEGDGVDFTVIVPIELKPINPLEVITFETKMKAQVNYYKLYSKNYIIRYE